MSSRSKYSPRFGLFYILGMSLSVLPSVYLESCPLPLGMENGNIQDSQITVSSVRKGTLANGDLARLRRNIPPWGAWCPDLSGGFPRKLSSDQYIQIDLLVPTKLTAIATQGRFFNGERQHVWRYIISYSNNERVWMFYKHKDARDTFSGAKIFDANKPNQETTIVKNELEIMARYIRVHPCYYKNQYQCLRLELYGCTLQQNKVLFYSMPVGQETENGKVQYKDSSYTGDISNISYTNGAGILTDGKFGPVNAKQFRGDGWVGWSTMSTQSQYIAITFEFLNVRQFKNVTITVNVDKINENAVFNDSRIFFATTKDDFSNMSFLRYCPSDVPVKNDPHNVNVTLSLCENAAKFVKMELYFGGEWLLITEISFYSVAASESKMLPVQNCSFRTPHSCVTGPATSVLPKINTTQITICKDCTTQLYPKYNDGGNTSTSPQSRIEGGDTSTSPQSRIEVKETSATIVIILVCGAVFFAIILVVLFGILKYKRVKRPHHAPKQSPTVSIPVDDVVVNPLHNNQEPDYAIPAELDIIPHAVVPMSAPSGDTGFEENIVNVGRMENDSHEGELEYDDVIPADLGKRKSLLELKIPPPGLRENREGEEVASKNGVQQRPSTDDSGYLIPADSEAAGNVEEQIYLTAGYTELDKNRQDETKYYAAYQKLLKDDSNYVIPADSNKATDEETAN